jgi:hypothetical protein
MGGDQVGRVTWLAADLRSATGTGLTCALEPSEGGGAVGRRAGPVRQERGHLHYTSREASVAGIAPG